MLILEGRAPPWLDHCGGLCYCDGPSREESCESKFKILRTCLRIDLFYDITFCDCCMPSLDSPSPGKTPNHDEQRKLAVAEFSAALTPLEKYCLPIHKPGHSHLLWFRESEAVEVQRLVETKGPHAVLERWAAKRTIGSLDGTETFARPAITAVEGERLRTLMIICLDPDLDPRSCNFNLYRLYTCSLNEIEEHKLLMSLRGAGILNLLPQKDELQNIELTGAEIVGTYCAVEWYGPQNVFGAGTKLFLGLELNPNIDKEIEVRISINQAGEATRVLWDKRLIEPGYEGHHRASFRLGAQMLQGLVPFLKELGKKPASKPEPIYQAIWLQD